MLLQVFGQQLSLGPQSLTEPVTQAEVQRFGLPTRVLVVHGSSSVQAVGQLLSQVSPASMTPFPH